MNIKNQKSLIKNKLQMTSSKYQIIITLLILAIIISSCNGTKDTNNSNTISLDTNKVDQKKLDITEPDVSGFEFETYLNEEFNFSIEYPSDWKIETSDSIVVGRHLVFIASKTIQDSLFVPFETLVDPFLENYNIIIDDSLYGKDLKEAIERDLVGLEKSFTKYKLFENSSYKFENYEYNTQIYSVDDFSEPVIVMATRYLIYKNHILLTCVANTTDYPEYKDLFLYITQSLQPY